MSLRHACELTLASYCVAVALHGVASFQWSLFACLLLPFDSGLARRSAGAYARDYARIMRGPDIALFFRLWRRRSPQLFLLVWVWALVRLCEVAFVGVSAACLRVGSCFLPVLCGCRSASAGTLQWSLFACLVLPLDSGLGGRFSAGAYRYAQDYARIMRGPDIALFLRLWRRWPP